VKNKKTKYVTIVPFRRNLYSKKKKDVEVLPCEGGAAYLPGGFRFIESLPFPGFGWLWDGR
jgi:hypothetical protein